MAPDFERLARMPWPNACCASSGIRLFELGFGPFMLEMRLPGANEDIGEFDPGIGGAHINDADGVDARSRRVDPEESRGLAALDATPELAFGRDDEVLVEGIGMGGDLDPFAAAGDHRQDRGAGCDHPHVVLQLRHVFRQCGFFRERPRKHELGLEYRLAALHPPIEGGAHPAQDWMPEPPLNVGDHLARIGLVPSPVKVLGHHPELDHKIRREVLWAQPLRASRARGEGGLVRHRP